MLAAARILDNGLPTHAGSAHRHVLQEDAPRGSGVRGALAYLVKEG